MEELSQLGKRLRFLREIHNYTQEHVASVLDISQNTYSMIERGESKLTVDRLGRLAELYDMRLSDLLDFSERTVIHQISHSAGILSEHVTIHNGLPDNERKFYHETINKLEAQVVQLHQLLEKLTHKLSA